jgi:rare lipoprotein A
MNSPVIIRTKGFFAVFIGFLVLLCFAILSACSTSEYPIVDSDGAPAFIPVNPDDITDAVPRYEPITRAGNPEEYEVNGKVYRTLKSGKGYKRRGLASWYGTKFHGKKTSIGEPYDMFAMTAAHKTLPIPSYAKVTNLENGRSIIVRINDRGPFHEGRVIDLSYIAAVKLGYHQTGTVEVEVEAINVAADQAVSTPSQRQYFLQIGAFARLDNARKLQDQIDAQVVDVQTRIDRSHQVGGAVYKVQIGPFSQTDQVANVSEQLRNLGLGVYHWVIE